MSAHDANEKIAGLQTKGLMVGGVGLVACGAAWAMDAERFYQAYLPGYLFWLAASLGCLGWTMIHHLTEGKWGFPVRRIWEAGSRTVWIMIPLFIPIFNCWGPASWAENMAASPNMTTLPLPNFLYAPCDQPPALTLGVSG